MLGSNMTRYAVYKDHSRGRGTGLGREEGGYSNTGKKYEVLNYSNGRKMEWGTHEDHLAQD